MVAMQLEFFPTPPRPTERQLRQARHFGWMDARTGMPRLNAFRAKQHPLLGEAYDTGYREAIAQLPPGGSAA